MSIWFIGDFSWECDQCGEQWLNTTPPEGDHICKPKQGIPMNIPTNVKRIYLASPYSHENEQVREGRFDAVALATAYLMKVTNTVVYSPIVHSHVVARYLGNQLDHDFWLTQDRSHIVTCAELIVYKLKGWDKSFGVSWEIGLCNGLGIPVSYLEPDEVTAWAESKGTANIRLSGLENVGKLSRGSRKRPRPPSSVVY